MTKDQFIKLNNIRNDLQFFAHLILSKGQTCHVPKDKTFEWLNKDKSRVWTFDGRYLNVPEKCREIARIEKTMREMANENPDAAILFANKYIYRTL